VTLNVLNIPSANQALVTSPCTRDAVHTVTCKQSTHHRACCICMSSKVMKKVHLDGGTVQPSAHLFVKLSDYCKILRIDSIKCSPGNISAIRVVTGICRLRQSMGSIIQTSSSSSTGTLATIPVNRTSAPLSSQSDLVSAANMLATTGMKLIIIFGLYSNSAWGGI
jgi:hypothetical protein